MKFLARIFLSTAFAAFCAMPAAAQQVTVEERELAERVAAMEQAYVLQHADEAYLELAHPDFMIVIYPGAVESLAMVVGTAENISALRWEHTLLEARIVGNTAVLTFRVDMEGSLAGQPLPSSMIETHTLVREDFASEWELLQTTMTPITMLEPIFQQLLTEALGQE